MTLVKYPSLSEAPISLNTTKELDFVASKDPSDFFNILEIYQAGEGSGVGWERCRYLLMLHGVQGGAKEHC